MKAASKFSLSKVKYNATLYRRKHNDRPTFSRQIMELDSTIDKSTGCVDQISHQLNVSWLIVRRPNVCWPSVSRSNACQSNAYKSVCHMHVSLMNVSQIPNVCQSNVCRSNICQSNDYLSNACWSNACQSNAYSV